MLQALLGSNYAWATALAVFAVVMSLIGAFYYLRVVKVMYFDPAQDQRELGGDLESKWILSLNALLLLVWGVLPSTLTDWIATAIKQTF